MPDISGVCSIVGTFEITSKPRKIASTSTVSSATSVAVWLTPATSFRVTHAPATISSSQSSASAPSSTIRPSSDATLRESSWLACVGIVAGRFVSPTIVTPSRTISSPGSVSSQLPPVSAARSTITEPGRIARTASAVTSLGAGRPGIAAVVITASNCGIRSCSSACCAACCSGVSSCA